MPAFSGLQQLLTGTTYLYTGFSLFKDPAAFLLRIRTLTELVEEKTGVEPYKGDDAGLALAGIAFAVLGYFFLMSVYTNDERFKRNTVSGRIFAALLSAYVCTSTPHGSSLVVLFGIFNAFTGLLMGLSVGWGDGNAVDLELKARALARQQAAAKKEGKGK